MLHRTAAIYESQMRRCRCGVAAVAVALAACAPFVAAQDSASLKLTPGVLRGVVTDTLGNPLADADIVLAESRRQARTSADGAFQFDRAKAGIYRVLVRRIGYVATSYEVSVSDAGGYVAARLLPIGNTLAAVTTIAAVGGLSGVIADTAFRALKDVEVTAVGTGKTVKTDSTGAFFIPLKAGQYMLRIEHDGFTQQTKSVMIPESEGRKIAAWLVPRTGPPNHFESNALFDLNQRIIRSSAASTKFFSNEELIRQGLYDLSALARNWANGSITNECDVGIGGHPSLRIPLAMLLVSEVEFVEVYMPSNSAGAGTRGVTSMSRRPTAIRTPTASRPAPSRDCGNLAIIAWLKQ